MNTEMEERLKAAESAARVAREDAEANAARAEKAEALLHGVEAALDSAGVARSNAPSADACTSRDTPERYPRFTPAERVKILAKSEKDTFDRLLDADAAKAKAEGTILDAMAIDQGKQQNRPQPHHPLLSIMAGNRQSLAEFSARAEKAEKELQERIDECGDWQNRLSVERTRADRAEAEVKRFKDREAHFASVLGVADGGQYQNDWDAAIRRVIARAGMERRFPIMNGPSVPWWAIASHEEQARINHGQTLERLAERGGLSPTEALAVLEDRLFPRGRFDEKADHDRLAAMVEKWDAPALKRAVVAWEIRDKDDRVVMDDHSFRTRAAAEAMAEQCRFWRWPLRAPFRVVGLVREDGGGS